MNIITQKILLTQPSSYIELFYSDLACLQQASHRTYTAQCVAAQTIQVPFAFTVLSCPHLRILILHQIHMDPEYPRQQVHSLVITKFNENNLFLQRRNHLSFIGKAVRRATTNLNIYHHGEATPFCVKVLLLKC